MISKAQDQSCMIGNKILIIICNYIFTVASNIKFVLSVIWNYESVVKKIIIRMNA